MKALTTLISLLHEIVLDFMIVLFSIGTAAKKQYASLSAAIRNLKKDVDTTRLRKIAIPESVRKTYTPYIKRYWEYLGELYTEVDDALESGYVPAFFVVSTLFTIILCCFIYYRALVS